MRGDTVHRIYGVHEGRTEDTHFGTYRTHAEAEAGIADLLRHRGHDWAQKYHNRGFVVRPATVDTDFEFPQLPKPRDKYVAVATPKSNAPAWDSSLVRVYRRGAASAPLEQICEFERNYAMLQTFEPFRKGGRDYALISRHYTRTAVLDLSTGEVIAEEEEKTPGGGFCPIGFYVPDWWDLHDGSTIPGSPHWDADCEWPTSPFGFVWGCLWGDDSSWKIQYLDLSQIENGVIKRDERFGYLELATVVFNIEHFAHLPPRIQIAGVELIEQRDDSHRRGWIQTARKSTLLCFNTYSKVLVKPVSKFMRTG